MHLIFGRKFFVSNFKRDLLTLLFLWSSPGDSGGPVFQYDNTGVPVLLGIASLAYKCSSQNVPVVFVRVEPYLSTFLGDVQLTLSNSTDVYILPEERRERPDYEGDSGIDKLSTTTIIIIAVCAGLIVLTVIIVFVACVIRRNRNKTSEQGGNVTAPVSNQDDVVTAQQHVPGSIQREGVV